MQDDDLPTQRRARLETPPLDPWGVEELQAYIRDLRAEIARAESAIDRKQSHRNAADAFFKT